MSTTAPVSLLARLGLSGGALTVAGASLLGAGTYAAWTSSDVATTGAQTTATVTQTNTDVNSTTFTTALTDLLPGDYLYRYRDVHNTGSVAQTMSAAVAGTGVYVATGGLFVAVDRCTVLWTGSSCSGTTSAVLASTDVATLPTASIGALAVDAHAYLRYTFTLASAASYATFGGAKTGTVVVTTTGATRAGQDRTTG